jgi:hypothetical protein
MDLLALWVLAVSLMGLGLLLAPGRRRIDAI